MNATSQLVKGYLSFFGKTAQFAFSPYTNVFSSVAAQERDPAMGILNGLVACSLLTAIPVLPVATLLTWAIATIAGLVAAASAFVTVPAALAVDAVANSLPAFK